MNYTFAELHEGMKFALAVCELFKSDSNIKDWRATSVRAVKSQKFNSKIENYLIKMIDENRVFN